MSNDEEQAQPTSPSITSASPLLESAETNGPRVERSRQDRRGVDDRRRKRGPGQEHRVPAGFGDGIERAICARFVHVLPPAFPVQNRPGIATSRPTEVARRVNDVLLCDRNHEGDCVWPDGSSSLENPRSAILSQLLTTELEGGVPPDALEGEAAKQEARGEPAQSGDDEDRDRTGIPNDD